MTLIESTRRTWCIEKVAKQIIINIINEGIEKGQWELYPEIGENDWADVENQIEALLMDIEEDKDDPAPNDFATAYSMLVAHSSEASQ